MDEKNKKYIKKGDTKNEKLDKELDHKEIKKIINVKEEPKIVKSTNDVKKIEESKVIKNDAKKIDKKEINKEYSFLNLDLICMHLKIYILRTNIMNQISILLLLQIYQKKHRTNKIKLN